MPKLGFEITPSGYKVIPLGDFYSPTGNMTFWSIESAIQFVEEVCPHMYGYQF